MDTKFNHIIAERLNISERQVRNTVSLLEEGATVPFISRYRKEATNSLDEVAVGNIKEEMEKLVELDKRKATILKTIEEQEQLTPELQQKIEQCLDPNELEDIYLPYKPKRRTRATIAREKGLEPLAKIVMKQFENDPEGRAGRFLSDEVPTVEDALAGARDIIAEWVNENPAARNIVRNIFARDGVIRSRLVKGKAEDGIKYRDYFEWEEPLKRCPSHRMLAMRRGEKEGFLKLSISPDEDRVMERLERLFVKGRNASADQVSLAVKDSYKRLLAPSIETEFFNSSKEEADTEAINVFAENLRQLLLSAPLGQKRVLAVDPGYRTGCKVVCLDAQGNLLHNETIYPHPPQSEVKQSKKKLSALVSTYKIEAIAIGNGTASRETEHFVKNTHYDRDLQVFVVSEDGASIYSASKVAREEFPQYDVTVRGSVSIGRRLMDPLAELVKIEPKSIGVGQYQHDVDQKQLQKSLDSVVESCVNLVGVNVNTASKHLLTYVSGLGATLAQNIVDYRKENGPFASREALKTVPRMGPKAYEQGAGFLRIPDAANPLDNSAVHPERYSLVQKMAKDLGKQVTDLVASEELRKSIDLNRYVNDEVGLPTLTDIIAELAKPGRDPRSGIKVFEFADGIFSINDLQPGMVLPGIVTNMTKFGCFVDVGVKQDGLVHISELADRFISDPNEVVKLHQHVMVKVLEVDIPRKRISLSLKQADR
ncbi:RNA-binding transcriptional accessory protein [Prolixibacter bellariivorans]|uniref:RNA-binding transcriptional accessory protein n=2 Tax=Prolixibacter bellariivorans TaxID=314319 RepID=A0A5M4B0Q0_9BACT|nr:Tex family protein [Prolixibacter bellariivorans]GET33735.1 RNA-binding transcriptional accessory protein [Prolixibacter bellariivorans]